MKEVKMMKNINKLQPQNAIVFNNGEEQLVLIKDVTEIILETDKTDFDEFYSGVITFINEDGIEVSGSQLIQWEFVKSINLA